MVPSAFWLRFWPSSARQQSIGCKSLHPGEQDSPPDLCYVEQRWAEGGGAFCFTWATLGRREPGHEGPFHWAYLQALLRPQSLRGQSRQGGLAVSLYFSLTPPTQAKSSRRVHSLLAKSSKSSPVFVLHGVTQPYGRRKEASHKAQAPLWSSFLSVFLEHTEATWASNPLTVTSRASVPWGWGNMLGAESVQQTGM